MNLINWETWIGIVFWTSLAIFGICYLTVAVAYCYNSQKALKVMRFSCIGVCVSGGIIIGFLLMFLIKAIWLLFLI